MTDALRLAAEHLLVADPGAAAKLRSERKALTVERRELTRRAAASSGVHEMIERTHRDIESRTSPDVEALRARLTAVDQRLLGAAGYGSSIAKDLRTLKAKGWDPAADSAADPGGLLDRLGELRSLLVSFGVDLAGTDLEVGW